MITFCMTLMAHCFGRRSVEDYIWVVAMMLGFLELMVTVLVLGEMLK